MVAIKSIKSGQQIVRSSDVSHERLHSAEKTLTFDLSMLNPSCIVQYLWRSVQCWQVDVDRRISAI